MDDPQGDDRHRGRRGARRILTDRAPSGGRALADGSDRGCRVAISQGRTTMYDDLFATLTRGLDEEERARLARIVAEELGAVPARTTGERR